jgi:RNA ligase (TIGR02306 family)
MSDFAVTIETLASVVPHPNADRLDLGKLEGIDYQFVLGKGLQKTGDKVLYFPIDAVLPAPLIEALGLTGKLAGKAKNRVKTIKLRGEISQGITGPISLVPDPWPAHLGGLYRLEDGKEDYSEALGVTKYIPEERFSNGPNGQTFRLNPLPSGVSKYDIENCERYRDQLAQLLELPGCVTEKLEGSHFIATEYPDGSRKLCSRNCEIAEETGTFWHRGAENSKVWESMDFIKRTISGYTGPFHITLRGELVGPGVQGNYYGLSDHRVYLFDAEVNGRSIDSKVLFALELPTPKVPILWARWDEPLRNYLGDQDIKLFSNGNSLLLPTKLREGIVIKPATEAHDRKLGRLFLKQRSPDYLAKSEL